MAEKIAAVVVASPTRRSAALSKYVMKRKKGQKTDRYVASSGINGAIPRLVEVQMVENRKRWGKNDTRTVTKDVGGVEKSVTEGQYVQAYHLIQSFARDGEGSLDPLDPEQWEKGHAIGLELAGKVAGENRFATVTTQIDGTTGCIHNHIVIDSVDKRTGRSFDSSHVQHKNLVAAHDGMLRDLGYEQANPEYQPTGKKAKKTLEKSELRAAATHEQWEADGRRGKEPFSVAVMRQRIEEALEETSFTTFEEFAETARDHDLDVQQRGEGGRGISYGLYTLDEHGEPQLLKNSKRRASKLGTDYMMDSVEHAAERNKTLQAQGQAQPKKQQPMAVREIPEDAFSGYDGKPDRVMLKMMHGWSNEEIAASIEAWEEQHQEQAEAREIPASAIGEDGRPSRFELMFSHGFSPEESDASIAAWEAEHATEENAAEADEHSAATTPPKPSAAAQEHQATEQAEDAEAPAQRPEETGWQRQERERREARQRREEEIAEAEQQARKNPDPELADLVLVCRDRLGNRNADLAAMKHADMDQVTIAAAAESWISLSLPETASERAEKQARAQRDAEREAEQQAAAERAAAQEPAPQQHRPEQPAAPVEETQGRVMPSVEPQETVSVSDPVENADQPEESEKERRNRKVGNKPTKEQISRRLDKMIGAPSPGHDEPQPGDD